MKSLALILPRYGKNLGGGAETLGKALIEKLHQLPAGHQLRFERLEVWTTCAQDHRTWENHFSPGMTIENELPVHRFPVDSRDIDRFIELELAIQKGHPLSIEEQLDWLRHSVNSTKLYEHIASDGQEFDVLLFAPYLFATSFWGALIYPERSLLIPCLHNECYAYLSVFRHLFHMVKGLLFNSEPEAELARRLYFEEDDFDSRSAVVGMGFDASVDERKLEKENRRDPTSPEEATTDNPKEPPSETEIKGAYLLYSGRKEQGKNLDFLIQCFEYLKQTSSDLKLALVIIGAGDITFCNPLPEGIYDLGFVSESRKRELMRNAVALCQPSVNESFSIVIMEAWLSSTPVLVHADCAVTRDHVVKAGGGLYFSNEAEFVAIVRKFLGSPRVRNELGFAGRKYVRERYSWGPVLGRFEGAVRKLGVLGEGGGVRAVQANIV